MRRGADGTRRVAALDALGEAPGDVADAAVPWLDDVSAAVREAAALAMAVSQRPGDAGPLVVAALGREPEVRVRAAPYQALANQLAFDADHVARLARAETTAELRLFNQVAIRPFVVG